MSIRSFRDGSPEPESYHYRRFPGAVFLRGILNVTRLCIIRYIGRTTGRAVFIFIADHGEGQLITGRVKTTKSAIFQGFVVVLYGKPRQSRAEKASLSRRPCYVDHFNSKYSLNQYDHDRSFHKKRILSLCDYLPVDSNRIISDEVVFLNWIFIRFILIKLFIKNGHTRHKFSYSNGMTIVCHFTDW